MGVAATRPEALSAAGRRIRRHRLLPHTQRLWERVAGALKSALLYDVMVAVPRGHRETLQQFTRRFVSVYVTETRRALLINLHSHLYDDRVQRDTVEALALPHLQATVVIGLVGLVRVVGQRSGVEAVASALERAGVPYVVCTT